MFCTVFLGRKTNFLDFNMIIGTQPSLSLFDQSFLISYLKYHVSSGDTDCCQRPANTRKVQNIYFFFSHYFCLLIIVVTFCVRDLFIFFIFDLSLSSLRHLPLVLYSFLPIVVTSYKCCVSISARYNSVLVVIG